MGTGKLKVEAERRDGGEGQVKEKQEVRPKAGPEARGVRETMVGRTKIGERNIEIKLTKIRPEEKSVGSDAGTEAGGRGRGKGEGKVQVAVIGDSMIKQAGGYVLAEEEACKVACLRGKGIQDILAEAKKKVCGRDGERHAGDPRRREQSE